MEEDEGSMRKAAHLMVSSLAGSLALVTCREPLRSSLATQLRHLLANSMEASQLEQTVSVSTVTAGGAQPVIPPVSVPILRTSRWNVFPWRGKDLTHCYSIMI